MSAQSLAYVLLLCHSKNISFQK